MNGLPDQSYMARAVRLARRGLYTADPNPRVGCVLVKAGEVIGEGWHEKAGGPHAERMALARARGSTAGASAFVTLEPCNHTGRTGPCSEALIAARVARVVCAGLDPNPLVRGGGMRRLEQAGVEVAAGVLEESAGALNPGYLARMTRGRPLVRTKLAVSLDGRTALAGGESRWITGEAARRDVHRWRARSSAVLTGIGTVLADDPALNARPVDAHGRVSQPARVIVDSRLRTPAQAKLLGLPGDVFIFTTREATRPAEALTRLGARVEVVPGEKHCDLARVMDRLGELEFNEVWVEAGPKLNGALLDAGLVDEVIVYAAPHVLGADARGMFAVAPLTSLERRVRLRYEDIRRVGSDLRITACLAES